MDLFDNAINKAKEVFDVAYKKTNDVVTTQKQKFDVASIESKRNKDYIRLGEIYYNMIKDTETENTEVNDLVKSITEKNEKIKELKQEINSAKNKRVCPVCNANIDENAVFCSACGTKLTIDGE